VNKLFEKVLVLIYLIITIPAISYVVFIFNCKNGIMKNVQYRLKNLKWCSCNITRPEKKEN